MAEAILRGVGGEVFNAFSAGGQPAKRVNPYTIHELHRRGYPTDGLHSKSWLSFAGPDSCELDFVITVCTSAAAQEQPDWSGSPQKLHWKFRAPGQVAGPHIAIQAAFEEVCGEIESAVKDFVVSQGASIAALPHRPPAAI